VSLVQRWSYFRVWICSWKSHLGPDA
jgi:hypothetical protein